jgi:hypothetical protein
VLLLQVILLRECRHREHLVILLARILSKVSFTLTNKLFFFFYCRSTKVKDRSALLIKFISQS